MGGGGRETLKPTACCIIDKEVVIAHTWEEEGRGQKQERGSGREGGGARQQQSVRVSHSFVLYVEIELHSDCD